MIKHKKYNKVTATTADRRISNRQIFSLAGLAMAVILAVMMSLPEERITFNFTENMGQWQISAGSQFRQIGGAVELKKGGPELYVVIPQMNIDADYYDVCLIEGAWPIAYDQGHLLFISPYNKQFDYNFRFDFDAGNALGWGCRYLDLRSHGAWQGSVKAVLLLPATNASQVTMKRIVFIHANPWTKIKAWWGDFTRYTDPLLGTCFAMATPILMGKPFNPFMVPFLWALLLIGGGIVAGVHYLNADQRISKIAAGTVLIVILLVGSVLDLRNNTVYLKGIGRNVSLYWGKTIREKRGTVIGDQEFIDFMEFCDKHIPLQARVINQVPVEVPGTPANYLSAVQYWANLRPRYYEGKAKSYYIYYKPHNRNNWELCEEQANVNEYIDISSGEGLGQEIVLWQPLNDLYQINLWLKGRELKPHEVEVTLLHGTGKDVIGRSNYLERTGDEAIFRFNPIRNTAKGEKVLLQITNKSKEPVAVGAIYGEQYREGDLIRKDQKRDRDLTFRLIYRPKSLVLFKRFNDEAYILLDEESR